VHDEFIAVLMSLCMRIERENTMKHLHFCLVWVLLAVTLTACGYATDVHAYVAPTTTVTATAITPSVPLTPPPVATATTVSALPYANKMITVSQKNVIQRVQQAIEIVHYYEPQIATMLQKCEIGVVTAQGRTVLQQHTSDTCFIQLVPTHVLVVSAEFRSMIFDELGGTYAIVEDKVGYYYPYMYVREGQYDLYFFARTIAHEGHHVMSLKTQTDCYRTDYCEEANAFAVEFTMLEKMYGVDQLDTALRTRALTEHREYRSLGHAWELEMYDHYTQGKLGSYLRDINYNGD
jgi:hypothetical protein